MAACNCGYVGDEMRDGLCPACHARKTVREYRVDRALYAFFRDEDKMKIVDLLLSELSSERKEKLCEMLELDPDYR